MHIETYVLALGTIALSAAVLYPLVRVNPCLASGLAVAILVGTLRALRHDLRCESDRSS